jgi:hypothetical protein
MAEDIWKKNKRIYNIKRVKSRLFKLFGDLLRRGGPKQKGSHGVRWNQIKFIPYLILNQLHIIFHFKARTDSLFYQGRGDTMHAGKTMGRQKIINRRIKNASTRERIVLRFHTPDSFPLDLARKVIRTEIAALKGSNGNGIRKASCNRPVQ